MLEVDGDDLTSLQVNSNALHNAVEKPSLVWPCARHDGLAMQLPVHPLTFISRQGQLCLALLANVLTVQAEDYFKFWEVQVASSSFSSFCLLEHIESGLFM